ncbi:acyltransferase family protein [Spongiibacter marinus]|uniref:acyltransferase family protein n=1 Tax=Spongiibacter marinus TaxID=354246 RepID=UPI00040DF506|nr:acyltransferase [Spongiibacter marinus]
MTSPKTSQHHIAHLHAFRGFAILNVIGAHAWTSLMFRVGGYEMADSMRVLYSLIQTVFHDATLYFAVISGLLFTRVLRGRPWANFYRAKLKNVILPYAILSVFFLTALWDWYVGYAADNGLPTDYATALLRGLLLGQTLPQFWYIPVLAVLFLITPVLDALIQHPQRRWLAVALVILPLFISRTGMANSVSVQTIVYFSGAYLCGMLMGQHYEAVQAAITRNTLNLFLLVLATSAALFALYANGYKSSGWLSYTESLFYIQKLAITALILHTFLCLEGGLPKLLHTLGDYAFAIYFLHLVFIFLLAQLLVEPLRAHLHSGWMFAGGLLVMLGSAALTLAASILLKKILGRYSRALIGS